MRNKLRNLLNRVRNFANSHHDYTPDLFFSYETGEIFSIQAAVLYPVQAWKVTGKRLATRGNWELARALWNAEQRAITLTVQLRATEAQLAGPQPDWEAQLLGQ